MLRRQPIVERSEQMTWEPSWIVERGEQDVARIMRGRSLELVWDTFEIFPLRRKKCSPDEMLSSAAYWHGEQIILRGTMSGVRFIPIIAADPFWLFAQQPGHLVIRCSYPKLPNPNFWQRVVLSIFFPDSGA